MALPRARGPDAHYEEEATAPPPRRSAVGWSRSARGPVGARLDRGPPGRLRLGLERKDASAALLAASERVGGVLGSVAVLVSVEPGFEAAVASALGGAAEAVAVRDLDSAIEAFAHLKSDDLGRAGMVLAGAGEADDRDTWPELPEGVRYAADVVTVADGLQGSVTRLLRKVAVTDDLGQARSLVERLPDVAAVTRSGDQLSTWWSAGGSGSQASLIEVQAAVDEASDRLTAAQQEVERLTFQHTAAEAELASATEKTQAALAALHESDARFSAYAEELGQLKQTSRAALAEAERLEAAIEKAQAVRDANLAALAELEQRLARAGEASEIAEADPSERDETAARLTRARQAEMEARLGLRTLEERARALAGQASSLRQRAAAERAAREQAAARRARLLQQAEVARAVMAAAEWLSARVDASQALAGRSGRPPTQGGSRQSGGCRTPGSAAGTWPRNSRRWSTSFTRTSWRGRSSGSASRTSRSGRSPSLGWTDALVAEYGPTSWSRC